MLHLALLSRFRIEYSMYVLYYSMFGGVRYVFLVLCNKKTIMLITIIILISTSLFWI